MAVNWGTIITLWVMVFGVSVLWIGFNSRETILSLNSCEMTYSMRVKEEIKVDNVDSNMKLYRYYTSNKAGEKGELSRQPVLFVPGHHGDPDQVRSLASAMHNKNKKLQYFVVEFAGQDSAFHASSVIMQASFVNKALTSIMKLYGKSSADIIPRDLYSETSSFTNTGQFEIVVVGHSIGGIIARTSVLLSNHPSCVVRNIITLSCPHQRPPYNVDISNDALYSSLNKAWKQSFFNESRECRLSKKLLERATQLHSFESPVGSVVMQMQGANTVEANWECPYCASKIRLLSISGGDVDQEVTTAMTHLDPLSPRPMNISSKRVAKTVIASGNDGIVGWLQSIIRFCVGIPMRIVQLPYFVIVQTGKFLFPSIGTGVRINSTDEVPVSSNITDICSNCSDVSSGINATVTVPRDCASVDENVSGTCDILNNVSLSEMISIESSSNASQLNATAAVSNYTVAEQYFQRISVQDWQDNFQMYSDFHHRSIRTSQMIGVKFPVDHQAILWCHQVIDKVTRAIHVLVNATEVEYVDFNFVVESEHPVPSASVVHSQYLPSNYVPFDTTAKFKYMKRCHRREYNRTLRLMKTVISPIAKYIERNESLEYWQDASKLEFEYLHKGLIMTNINAQVANILASFRMVFFNFVTERLTLIAMCYVLTSIAIASSPILHSLIGNKHVASMTYWQKMNPLFHLSISLLIHSMRYWARVLGAAVFGFSRSYRLVSLLSQSMYLVIITVVGYGVYQASTSPIAFYLQWKGLYGLIAAYCIALAIRGLGLVAIRLLRFVIRGFLDISSICLRWTIWCRPIRRAVRSIVKTITAFVFTKLNFPVPTYESTLAYWSTRWITYFVCTAFVLLFQMTGIRAFGSTPFNLGIGTYFWCHVCVIAYALLIILLLRAMLFPISGNKTDISDSEASASADELSLLYIIVIPCAWPSSNFAFALLFNSSKSLAETLPIMGMFGPDRISFAFVLIVVCMHLVGSRNPRRIAANRVASLPWLRAILNPEQVDEVTKSSLAALSKLGPDTGCMHEDGGKYAIMESTADMKLPLTNISSSVILGPTYKVVFCACYRDRSMKKHLEWCEWCRCQHCGGKHIPKDIAASFGFDTTGKGFGSSLSSDDDFNVEFGLFVLLLVAEVITLAYFSKNNNYTYAMGVVAACYCLRDFALRFFPNDDKN